MPFYDAIRIGASGASTGYEVERSIRLNRPDNAKFSKTFSSAGNRRKWTFSVWAKFPDPIDSNTNQIFSYQQGHVNHRGSFYKGASGVLNYQLRVSGSRKAFVTTDAQLRDPSAWYHIVLVIDSDQGSSTNRVKIYINGVQQSVVYHDTPTSGFDTWINSTQTLYLGAAADENGGNMYLAEINFIDGQAYDPSYFGETNSLTGQWVPIEYTGSYTGNSFHLKFDDNSNTTATTLGKDSSGLGNNWTPNNFSVAAGAGNDSVTDTPTNNFCTMNPLDMHSSMSIRNGALQVGEGNDWRGIKGTFGVSSGKWYYEFKTGNSNIFCGWVADDTTGTNNISTNPQDSNSAMSAGVLIFCDDGKYQLDTGGSGTRINYSSALAVNDVLGCAIDLDNNTAQFYKQGSALGSIDISSSKLATKKVMPYFICHPFSDPDYTFNFGQQAFAYTPPTGYQSLCSANLPEPTIKLPNKHFDTLLYSGTGSANSVTGLNFAPDWVWAKVRSHTGDHLLVDQVRGGSKSSNSNNTDAESSLANRDATFLSNGIRWNGNSLTCNESGKTYVAWNWNAGDTDGATYRVVVVSDSGNKYRFRNSANTATFAQSAVTLDLAEGGTYTFDQSDSSMSSHPMQLSTTANGTHGGGSAYSTGVTYELDGSTVTASAFISGFSSASSRKLIITVAASAPTLYYYCYYHSGMGGQANTNSTLGSSNFDGSIQSTAKVNTTAGFSIVTYTGNGTGGATIGHGLGVAADWIIAKVRNASRSWAVGSDNSPWTLNLRLDEDSTPANTSQSKNQWYESTPTSTVFYVGDGDVGDYSGDTNVNNENYVAYCFSEVEGYSKFGSYTGNNANDGTFFFTGFSVAWLMVKRTDSARDWLIYDNTRSTFNPIDDFLEPNKNTVEQQASANSVDFVSNGFKFRNNSGDMNGSGTYLFFAFAESPFKNSRAR